MLFTVIIEIYLYFFVFFSSPERQMFKECRSALSEVFKHCRSCVGLKAHTGQVRKEYEQVPPQS